MKGRPRDPKRAKRRTGHRRKPDEAPKLRALPAPAEMEPEVLAPPPDLPDNLREMWGRIVGELGGITALRGGDAFVLEALVTQYARLREAGELVNRYGIVHKKASNEITASPFLKAEREAAAMFLRLAEHYGLTVASRLRLGLMHLQGKTLAQALNEDLER